MRKSGFGIGEEGWEGGLEETGKGYRSFSVW